MSAQTVAYGGGLNQNFAFIGEFHIYIYSMRGATTLQSIIPFCDKMQVLPIEQQ